MSSMGWYRKCEECSNLIKKGPVAAVDNPCRAHPKTNKNRDHNCPSFKRIWWMFWVPGENE